MMRTIEVSHWQRLADGQWPAWCRNFSPEELACRGTGALRLDLDALEKLQALRDRLGVPLIIHSAYRSPSHNRAVGGAKRSQHLEGKAFDIAVVNVDPHELIDAARAVGFTGIGTYPRQRFVHVDTGPTRAWGEAFAPRRSRFAPEPRPERAKTAAKDTAKIGAGALAGAAGVVAAAGQHAEAIGDLSDRIAPHLGWAGPVIAVMVAGGLLAVAAVLVWQRVRP